MRRLPCRLGKRLELEDLRRLDDGGISQLLQAIKRSGVVVISGQNEFSRADQWKLSKRLGRLSELPPSFEGGCLDPVIGYGAMRRNSNYWSKTGAWKGPEAFGDYFHQDGNFWPRPHRWLLTMLYCVAAPAHGGETAFADLQVPLPPELEDRAKTAKIVVDVRRVPDFIRNGKECDFSLFDIVEHPVFDTLPFSPEEPVLFLGNPFVLLTQREERDDDLRDRLFKHVTSELYVHKWAPGDVVLWDNLQTLHKVMPFDNASPRAPRRELYRTQIRLMPDPAYIAQHPTPPGWSPRYEDPITGDFIWTRQRTASQSWVEG